jgi:hypothetical protein
VGQTFDVWTDQPIQTHVPTGQRCATPDKVAIYRASFCKETHEAQQTIHISLRTEPYYGGDACLMQSDPIEKSNEK